MKLSKPSKFQKLHIHSLSFAMGSKLSLFLPYRQRFPRYGPIFKICHIWTQNLARSAHTLFLPHRVEKLNLFLLHGQRFPRYRPILKLPYLGLNLGKCPKIQKLHIYNLNYSRVPNFTPFCSTIARFLDY